MPMISAPQQNGSKIQRDATVFVVLMGDTNGNRPTLADELDYLEVLSVQTSAGAQRIDAVKLRYNLATAEMTIQDVAADMLGSNRLIEVRATDAKGNFTRVVGWGKLESSTIELDAETQSCHLVARLDPFLFGDPLQGWPYWNSSQQATVDDAVVFNPLIDELVYGNMSSQQAPNGQNLVAAPAPFQVFLDPESMRTTNGQQQHPGETASNWDLANAVFFLCQWLNPAELFITNPQLADLQGVFSNFDAKQFRNMRVPIGTYLPDALDSLLKPYGFWWYLENSATSGDAEATSTIRCFQRGKGTAYEIYQDADGDAISIPTTNINRFQCETSLSQTYNEIDAASDLQLVESTFALVPGWDPGLDGVLGDDTFFAQLTKENLTSANYDVGRKWVVNEAGDYSNRSLPGGGGNVTVPAMPFTGEYQIKRRKLEKCLSTNPDGESFGFWLQGWNPSSAATPPDGTGAFDRLTGFSVLKKEMGIYFEGDLPEYNLCQYATNGMPAGYSSTQFPFGIYITACVRGDNRRWGIATRQPTSPQGQTVRLALDLKNKFSWKSNTGPGINIPFGTNTAIVAAAKGDNPAVSDLVDPFEDGTIQAYAETLRDWQDVALLSISVALDGADHAEYKIGQTVSKVAGREIALNCRNPAQPGDDPRHPQIIGVNYVFDATQQRQELVLESFRRETFPELLAKGEGRKLKVNAQAPHAKAGHFAWPAKAGH